MADVNMRQKNEAKKEGNMISIQWMEVNYDIMHLITTIVIFHCNYQIFSQCLMIPNQTHLKSFIKQTCHGTTRHTNDTILSPIPTPGIYFETSSAISYCVCSPG